jgi:RNA polymerase sigma-70 factor (ECF subfamily)
MKLRTRRLRELHCNRPVSTESTSVCAEIADCTPTPEQRYSQEGLLRILASAMDELPMTFREVLHLREVEEHSVVETATILGLSISTVKSRVHHGRQKLRQALTKYFSESGLAGFSCQTDAGPCPRGRANQLQTVHRR